MHDKLFREHLRCFHVAHSVNLTLLFFFNFLSDEEMWLWFRTTVPAPWAKYLETMQDFLMAPEALEAVRWDEVRLS